MMPPILMSICRAVMPSLGARDLEVHVAVMVFGTGDVGQDRVSIAFHHQAHRNARDRLLDRHAGVHQAQTCRRRPTPSTTSRSTP